MATIDRFGFRATAAIAGHPLHPLLITLPVGFLIGALLSDIGSFASADPFWGRTSAWLIGAGLVGGALAAIAGFTDFFGNKAIRSINLVWFHFVGNAIALVIAAINLYLRLAHPPSTVTTIELILSILVVAIFAVTGWLGGELVFRHGVGAIPTPESGAPQSPRIRPNDRGARAA